MDEKSATCAACGIMGLPQEMHRTSLPIPGTLPTVPNQVQWACRDEAACLQRITNQHRNDALLTSDDPLYAAGNVIDRLRHELGRVASDLAAVQDCLGRARVRYLQEPTEDMVERAAVVIARRIAGEESYAEDPRYHEAARAAIKAALYDAEDPIDAPDPDCPVPDAVLETIAQVMEVGAEGPDELSWYGIAKKVVAAIPRTLWAEPDHELCLDDRFDKRGDCDGPIVRAELRKPNEFGVPIRQSGGLVALCRSHWQQAYRAGEVGAVAYDPKPGLVYRGRQR